MTPLDNNRIGDHPIVLVARKICQLHLNGSSDRGPAAEISVQPASVTMIATTFMVREGLIVTGDSIKACSIAVLAQEILHFADFTLRACTVSPIHLVKNGIGKARYTGNKCCSTNASQTGRPGSPFSATWSETSSKHFDSLSSQYSCKSQTRSLSEVVAPLTKLVFVGVDCDV